MTSGRPLDYADRWIRDGIDVCRVPAYCISAEVDMSHARALIESARKSGTRLTYTHIIIRATALALARNPDLHRVVCGKHVRRPANVDIALSVAGESAAAPLLVVSSAETKSLREIADEVMSRAPQVRGKERH